MTKYIWGIITGLCIAIGASAYASDPPQGRTYVDANKYMTLVGDLRFFRDFHDSLLVLCDEKMEDSLCPPRPTRKPKQ